MSGDRRKLAKLMNTSRAEQRATWEIVAMRGQTSVATLRRVRNQFESELTEDTKLAIEDGLRWVRGDVDRILAGGEYTYRAGAEPSAPKRKRAPLDPLTSSPDEILAFLQEVRRYQGEGVYRELYEGTIEVRRLAAEQERKHSTSKEHEEL